MLLNLLFTLFLDRSDLSVAVYVLVLILKWMNQSIHPRDWAGFKKTFCCHRSQICWPPFVFLFFVFLFSNYVWFPWFLSSLCSWSNFYLFINLVIYDSLDLFIYSLVNLFIILLWFNLLIHFVMISLIYLWSSCDLLLVIILIPLILLWSLCFIYLWSACGYYLTFFTLFLTPLDNLFIEMVNYLCIT